MSLTSSELKDIAEYIDKKKKSVEVGSETITKKLAALEVSKYLLQTRSLGIIVTIMAFSIPMIRMFPNLRFILTLIMAGIGIVFFVRAQLKLKGLNDKYSLGLKLDFQGGFNVGKRD